MAEAVPLLAGQIEAGDVDKSLFADLERPQTQVDHQRQQLRSDLIKAQARIGQGGHFLQLPAHGFGLGGFADRLAHHHPLLAGYAIHQEGRARFVPQDVFIAQERQPALRIGGARHDILDLIDILFIGHGRQAMSDAEQTIQTDKADSRRHDHQGAQEARHGGAIAEMSPHPMGIRHMAIDIETAPHDQAQCRQCHPGPDRVDRQAHQRRFAIESVLARDQQQCADTEADRRDDGQFTRQREDGAETEQRDGHIPGGFDAFPQAARQQDHQHADDSADEVRDFDEAERQPAADDGFLFDRRQHGQQQERAGGKHNDRENAWQDLGRRIEQDTVDGGFLCHAARWLWSAGYCTSHPPCHYQRIIQPWLEQ